MAGNNSNKRKTTKKGFNMQHQKRKKNGYILKQPQRCPIREALLLIQGKRT